MAELSTSELQTLVSLLKKLEPGFLPQDVFTEFTRISVTAICEVVPLRKNTEGKVEVLLLQREEGDVYWPGKLHTPGTVIRSTDEKGSMKMPFQRVLKELDNPENIPEPTFVDYLFHKNSRGSELAIIHYIHFLEEPVHGRFYSLENLPETLVQEQIPFIHMAAKIFLQDTSK